MHTAGLLERSVPHSCTQLASLRGVCHTHAHSYVRTHGLTHMCVHTHTYTHTDTSALDARSQCGGRCLCQLT